MNQNVLITDATFGIGLCGACLFAECGSYVFLVGRRPDRLIEIQKELTETQIMKCKRW
ncbi:hypothetical protein [Veillonella agrestimuris]|uniref:hypothetical protein n=1 Tax=Veillonella agrestimuris TaxID=2941340 RepID=UPI002041EEF2|nr:hypothetical protein [Veillonella agrestimuris]